VVRLAGELFAQKGFRATTVREIADAAGILSGSLYHHFDSKESIGDEILSSFINDVLADYRAGTGRRWPCCRTTGATSPRSRGSATFARE
jgi:AcrR family transcriptional regulator